MSMAENEEATPEPKTEQTGKTCAVCRSPFAFSEEETIYADACEKCVRERYPLTYAVREEVKECHGIEAAREVFGLKHCGCVPDSMMGENVLNEVWSLFKIIGHVIAEGAGLSRREHTVVVEPSYEASTWWVVIKNQTGTYMPDPVKSQIVFFEYTKAWQLGERTDDEIECLLQGWKSDLERALKRGSVVQAIVQTLESTEFSKLN